MEHTKKSIAAIMHKERIAFTEADLRQALAYLKGQQQCKQFDCLSDWVKMMVETYEKDNTCK